MPADNGPDPLDRWLDQQVRPLPPPSGTFELITKRARRRRIRKAVISVASAAVVAAAIGVAVPVGMSLRLSTSPTGTSVAAGDESSAPVSKSQSALGTGTNSVSPSPLSSGAATASSPASTASGTTGPVPANFAPSSVTFVNTSIGWVIGQAGTPGSCANKDPYICTSIARTNDAGKTWGGDPAPDTGAPSNATGVSGIRFLDGVNGWAFGPELWVTHDAGQTWTRESTAGARVTDLETAGDRAYALFATCSNLNSADPGVDWAHCTSYTLMTTTKDSSKWAPVSGTTNGLTDGGAPTSGYIALYGTTGYLVAPDGTLYSGPTGGTWAKVGTMPCQPGNANYTTGQAGTAQLATINAIQLATFCSGATPTSPAKVYTSADGGAIWTASSAQWPAGSTQTEGEATSIAATANGTIVLGTLQGIAILPAGATTWQAATVNGSMAAKVNGLVEHGGFTYVGMTSPNQGVAISEDTGVHEIWLTTDGGRTWTPSAIK